MLWWEKSVSGEMLIVSQICYQKQNICFYEAEFKF